MFNTEIEIKTIFEAVIGWKWPIKNEVYIIQYQLNTAHIVFTLYQSDEIYRFNTLPICEQQPFSLFNYFGSGRCDLSEKQSNFKVHQLEISTPSLHSTMNFFSIKMLP